MWFSIFIAAICAVEIPNLFRKQEYQPLGRAVAIVLGFVCGFTIIAGVAGYGWLSLGGIGALSILRACGEVAEGKSLTHPSYITKARTPILFWFGFSVLIALGVALIALAAYGLIKGPL